MWSGQQEGSMEEEVNIFKLWRISCTSFNQGYLMIIWFTDISVAASVPGGIYSDLSANGTIFTSEIYFRYNDNETRWVGRTNWTFSRNFTGNKAHNCLIYLIPNTCDVGMII